MNREFEALVLAYDATLDPHDRETERLAVFRGMMDDLLSGHPGVSEEALLDMVEEQHRRWVAAQRKHSSLPPQA